MGSIVRTSSSNTSDRGLSGDSSLVVLRGERIEGLYEEVAGAEAIEQMLELERLFLLLSFITSGTRSLPSAAEGTRGRSRFGGDSGWGQVPVRADSARRLNDELYLFMRSSVSDLLLGADDDVHE